MDLTYRRALALAILCWWAAEPVAGIAAETVAYGPPADWIEPQSVPSAPIARTEAPIQILLSDLQVNLAPGTSEYYNKNVVLIQTPEGLATAGSIALSWRPETDAVTVHRLSIVRDGQEIDVLAAGRTFTILRREDLLEYAILSGQLTAVVQPEGLRVGDRIQLEYTLSRTDPLLGGVPEQALAIPPGVPIARNYLRARWPANYPMKWQATTFLDGVKSRRAGNFMEVVSLRDNDEPLQQPAGAPFRFAAVKLLQITGHRSWTDISKLVYPLFARASTLPQTSPLRAEIERIRQSSADAAGRAEAALRLVQDQIRYVYLGMNDGPLVPADVDTTWTRRYGDCKAKTALLLAILHELDVEAEPVAVSVALTDALPDRLPMIRALDHVLVRATIERKTYWLDGTRTGDRHLNDLPTPKYSWGLPLRSAGSELQKIDVAPLTEPMTDTVISVDASAGSSSPATFRTESVMRADTATAVQRVLAGLTDKQRDTALRNYWLRQRYWASDWHNVTLRTVTSEFDDASGRLRLTMAGEGSMIWNGQKHLLGSLSMGDYVDLKRAPGPNSGAPYVTSFPAYERVTERIRMPYGRVAFAGPPFSRNVAGVQYERSASIEQNDELVSVMSTRSLRPEFPASEASEAQRMLREMWDQPFYAVMRNAADAVDPPPKPGPIVETEPLGSCVPSVPEAELGAPGSAGAPLKPELKILAISPANRSTVRKDSVLSADLEYSAPDFEPERFKVIAQFDETGKGRMTSGGTFEADPILKTAAGKLHFCFPMAHVWEGRYARPFAVRFFLTRKSEGSLISVLAMSETLTFPADDAPAAEAAKESPQ